MKAMKSIVFAVTNDLSYDQRMQRFCTALQNSGCPVELIGRQHQHSSEPEHTSFRQRRLRCLFSKGPLFYAEYNFRLFFVLLRHPADIFGACDLDTALAVCLAAKIKKRKSVFDAHEHFTEVPEVESRKFVKSVWHAIGKWCIPRFHVRFTVGDSLAEILSKEFKAPFSVIRNIPELNEAPILTADKREKLIVYQGALNEGRGLEHAITAMKDLPDFRFRLIGEGDLSIQLRALTTKLGLNDRVEFAGYILPKDLHALTYKSLVGLNLLEARSMSYYHSLANKFFDYLHAGVPSINMNFPEYRKIIDKYRVGVCIDTLSPEEIVKVVLKITAETEVLESMIHACATARMEFTWQKEQVKLLDIIRKIGN